LGFYTLRFAGLFNLPIPLRCAFGIGVSQINDRKAGAFGAFILKKETKNKKDKSW